MTKEEALRRSADIVVRLHRLVDAIKTSPGTVGSDKSREIVELTSHLEFVETNLGLDIDDFMAARYQTFNEEATRQMALQAGWDGQGAIPYHLKGEKVRRLIRGDHFPNRRTG